MSLTLLFLLLTSTGNYSYWVRVHLDSGTAVSAVNFIICHCCSHLCVPRMMLLSTRHCKVCCYCVISSISSATANALCIGFIDSLVRSFVMCYGLDSPVQGQRLEKISALSASIQLYVQKHDLISFVDKFNSLLQQFPLPKRCGLAYCLISRN